MSHRERLIGWDLGPRPLVREPWFGLAAHGSQHLPAAVAGNVRPSLPDPRDGRVPVGQAQRLVLRPLWGGATMMLACRCGARFEDVTALLRHSRIDHRVTTHWRPMKAPGELVKPRKIMTAEARDIVAYARREVQP